MRTQVTFVVEGSTSPHICDDSILTWVGSSFTIEKWSVIHLEPEELQRRPFEGSKLSDKMNKNKPIRKKRHD